MIDVFPGDVMLIEETTKTISMRPIALIVCFVCLIGLSASVTFLIVHAKYQRQLDNKNQEVQTIQENNKALTDRNIELSNSLHKLEDEYGKLDAQLSQMEALQADRQALEQKHTGFKETLVLKPTWVRSGETTPAFDGNLRIVLHEVSDKDECQKDSAVAGYLTGDTDKKILCLRTGKPEDFTYQGKNYSFNLSGIAAQAGVYRYYISISSER